METRNIVDDLRTARLEDGLADLALLLMRISLVLRLPGDERMVGVFDPALLIADEVAVLAAW